MGFDSKNKPPIPDPAWGRARGETSRAYHAFRIYRDLGPGRTLARVQEALSADSLSYASSRVGSSVVQWGPFFSWVERSARWDEYIESRRARVRAEFAEKWERRRLENLEKTWELAGTVRGRAEEMIAWPLFTETVEKDGQTYVRVPSRWNLGTAADLLRLAHEMGIASIAGALNPSGELDPAEAEGIRKGADAAETVPGTPPGGRRAGSGRTNRRLRKPG